MEVPTTLEQWFSLREDVKQTTILTRTPTQTIELRICAILTFISGLLYALSFFKRRSRGAWVFKKDNEGYWHPNVHTTLPISAVLYVILDVSAVIFIEMNLGHPIDPIPVAMQLVAYQTLQVFAWLKIWAVLYALLFSRQRLSVNAVHLSKTRRLVSPQIFNAFNSLIIITVILGQLPLIYFLCSAIQKFRHQVNAMALSFQQVIDVSPEDDTTAIYDAALQTFLEMGLMKKQANKADLLFKIYTIFIMVWMCFNMMVYLTSTSFLLHALGSQKNFLTSALENRKALKLIQQHEQEDIDSRHSITSWMIESPSSPTFPNHEVTKSSSKHKSFNPWTWRSWIDFANDESLNGHVFWDRIHHLDASVHVPTSPLDDTFRIDEKGEPYVCPNDAALEKHCTTLIRYWHSTLWQTIIGLGMFASYLVMAGWLLSQWARSTSQDKLIQAFVWSNWTWGGGSGLLLGIVACIVAFSPTPTLPSDIKPENSGTSKFKSPPSKGNTESREMAEAKFPEGGPVRGAVETLPALGSKAPRLEENLSIGRLEWPRPSHDFIRTEKNQSSLDRQISNSSTYSSCSRATAREGFLRKDSAEKMDWLKLDTLEKEDLVEDEWSGGHFKAIQRLRDLRRSDIRSTRFSQRARSRIL
ncbi:hypothetical protein PtB15_4B619 [Puccinia triticina]|nr:hypothetical protein PtB15_4B619 [Puccinia triticina]